MYCNVADNVLLFGHASDGSFFFFFVYFYFHETIRLYPNAKISLTFFFPEKILLSDDHTL